MLLYSKDVSKLPQYVASKPHFLWDDIQLSKGKLNPDRMVTMNINGIDEEVFYRMAPCNGVKVCSALDCSHAKPLNSNCVQSIQVPQLTKPVVVQWFSCICFHENSLMIIEGTCKEIIMSVNCTCADVAS